MIKMVHSGIPSSQKYFRPVLDRIVKFCEQFETEADVDELFEHIIRNHISPEPTALIFVDVDENDEIKAHMLANIESYFNSRNVTITQYWKDKGHSIPKRDIEMVLDNLRSWGKNNGATKLRIFARNEAVSRVLSRYGFRRPNRVEMISTEGMSE